MGQAFSTKRKISQSSFNKRFNSNKSKAGWNSPVLRNTDTYCSVIRRTPYSEKHSISCGSINFINYLNLVELSKLNYESSNVICSPTNVVAN